MSSCQPCSDSGSSSVARRARGTARSAACSVSAVSAPVAAAVCSSALVGAAGVHRPRRVGLRSQQGGVRDLHRPLPQRQRVVRRGVRGAAGEPVEVVQVDADTLGVEAVSARRGAQHRGPSRHSRLHRPAQQCDVALQGHLPAARGPAGPDVLGDRGLAHRLAPTERDQLEDLARLDAREVRRPQDAVRSANGRVPEHVHGEGTFTLALPGLVHAGSPSCVRGSDDPRHS